MEMLANALVIALIVLLMARAIKRIKKNGVCEGGCAGCPNAANCGKKR